MNQTQKKKTIATKVIAHLITTICLFSMFLTVDIWLVLEKNLGEAEEKYMSEVIHRVSLEINREIDSYLTMAEGISQNYILTEFLKSVEEETSEGHGAVLDATTVGGYEDAMAELKIVADMFGDSILRVAICSLYKDNFLTHTGERGGENFSLTSLPYYMAVTQKSTYISDPYDDILTNAKVIAIAEPMYDASGQVNGMVTIEFTTEHLSKIAESTHFGESGNTYLLDRSDNILVYSDASYLGQPLSSLNFTGDELTSEILNPTGIIVDYTKNGVKRTGGVSLISDLSGWKMISAIDSSEFDSSIQEVVQKLVFAQFITVVVTAFFCARNIFKSLAPMKELEDYMEEIAKGNLGASLDYDIPNEIGRLAHHMNVTTQTLSGYIDDIDKTMTEFEKGNFSMVKSAKYQGDFRSIQKSMERFVDMMSSSLHELSRTIRDVNQGATQLSSGAQVLSSGSTEQASNVVGLNHLIGSINDTIVETAKNSSSVTSDAENISTDLVRSNDKMQELVVSVQDIRQMSDEVKRIIKSIEEVAFQTNILSLNASVEAARAGSSGKGFAVVADEVRMLSTKTAEAAEETTKIINDIATAIETGSDLAQSTSTDLQKVVDDVDVFVQKISTISLSAQDQAEAIEEINKGIEEISQVVTKNSAISEQSAAASEELSAQSDVMQSLVEKFKLK